MYHLNIGQPDIETPAEFQDAVNAYKEKVIAYGNSKGLDLFLDSLEAYYQRTGLDIVKEDIVVTTGGSEALSFAMCAVASPGDEILVFEPFYTNYNGFAIMGDIQLVPVVTKAETGFHLPSAEEIEKHITPKTKAILICNPNNPTGTVLTIDELNTIRDVALKHNLYVLSDEVYREFIYEGETKSVLQLEGLEDRAILLDSLSKRYSLCGGRMGCVVTKNKELAEVFLRFGQARLCTATLEQVGSAALVDAGDAYFRPMIDEYRKRRDATFEELKKIPDVVCLKPNGAFYIMAKLPVADIDDFAAWMLREFRYENETVMIAPGPGFYATAGKGNDEARLAYVLNEKDCRRAIQIIAKGIEAYNALSPTDMVHERTGVTAT